MDIKLGKIGINNNEGIERERTASKCTKESKDKKKRQKGCLLRKVWTTERKERKKEY